MLSHPIVLEYIKTYDIIHNFKNLITKSLPSARHHNSIFAQFNEKLTRLDMLEFNNESKITPQIVQMTTSVDHTLNEIQTVFTQLVDELVSSKFEIFDKEQQLQKTRSRPGSELAAVSPNRPPVNLQRSITGDLKREKSVVRSESRQREASGRIRRLEKELQEKEELIERLNTEISMKNEAKATAGGQVESSTGEALRTENREQSDLYLLSQKQYPVKDELSTLRENYKDLEKQYVLETEAYKSHIK